MAGQKPGPICSSKLGPDWIDAGTMCRSRTSPPGPLGCDCTQLPAPEADRSSSPHMPLAMRLATSLVMGATPKKPERLEGEKAMIQYDIELIAGSPFGLTPEGRKIVKVLHDLDARDGIAYGETGGARGDFYGTGITVNKDYHGNACQTILELVHEASHATWRAKHPLVKGKPESLKEATDNELFAQENELKIYTWLKDKQHLIVSDPEMEQRLKRQADGTLRSVIEAHEREERESK